MSTETVQTAATETPNAVQANDAANVEAAANTNAAAANQTTQTQQDAIKPVEAVVPEKYELKLQEESLIDQSYLESFEAYAKEKKLSQDQAQELLQREETARKSYYDSQIQKWEQVKEQWKQQTIADPEIGGEKFAENAELAKRTLEKFSTPQFVSALDSSGYGNHPELVRVFARIGQAMREAKIIGGNVNTGGQKSIEDIFYGSKQN
jgi:hypothetical protein